MSNEGLWQKNSLELTSSRGTCVYTQETNRTSVKSASVPSLEVTIYERTHALILGRNRTSAGIVLKHSPEVTRERDMKKPTTGSRVRSENWTAQKQQLLKIPSTIFLPTTLSTALKRRLNFHSSHCLGFHLQFLMRRLVICKSLFSLLNRKYSFTISFFFQCCISIFPMFIH